MTISIEQLKAIYLNAAPKRLEALFPHLYAAMLEGDLLTPIREAAFLAQLAHESAEFRFFEEIGTGLAYEGRKDLGNTEPGDGPSFKGRGPIQLTGRANYQAAAAALKVALIDYPEKAATPEVGFRVAVWFWNSRGLSKLADLIPTEKELGRGLLFNEITRRINGGLNGKAQRDAYFARARSVLGC